MTIGELARLFNEHFAIGADLEVVTMDGWRRADFGDEAGAPWIMPSPNMPTLDTAVVYPGTVLLEGTLASEGRGTTRPFEVVGAPWVHAEAFADRLNAHALPGVVFRPLVFEPTFQKHHGVTCGGCQMHVTDRRAFPSVAAGVAVIEELRRANPTSFAWRPPQVTPWCFWNVGSNSTGRKTTPGSACALSRSANASACTHGAPTTSKGRVVPRPSDARVPSSSTVPG